MRLRDIYHKGDIVKCLVAAVVAFVIGALGFIAYSAFVWNGTKENVSAAWHQVTVRAEVCDCVAKLAPIRSLGGSGTVLDPYIVDNANVDMVVGVNGEATFEIVDQFGDVLLSYEKKTGTYDEIPFEVELGHGVGDYDIYVVMIDGTSYVEPVWIRWKAIDPNPPIDPPVDPPVDPEVPVLPEVPDTGYIYIAGYAFRADGVIGTGIVSFIVVFLVMMGITYVHYLRRRGEAERIKREKVSARGVGRFGKK